MSSKTVAVITSTIGRDHLRRAILSVAQQDYPCRHYVFVDGEQHHEKARQILQEFPHVCAVYLPMNTGSDGWTNSSINAIAPFLVQEDIICYLDDDNFYEHHHVSDVVATFERTNSDMVYTLRNMVDGFGNYLCRDKVESIGWKSSSVDLDGGEKVDFKINFEDSDSHWSLKLAVGLTQCHIDTNCMAFKTEVARVVAPAWRMQKNNDKVVFQVCKNLKISHACTGRFSVNYFLEVKKAWVGIFEVLQRYVNGSEGVIEKIIHAILPAFYESNTYEMTADDVAMV